MKFDYFVGLMLLLLTACLAVCLVLVFYLDGAARVLPGAYVMLTFALLAAYVLYKAFRDGVFPGGRDAPAPRATAPVKFWLNVAVTLLCCVFFSMGAMSLLMWKITSVTHVP